MLKTKPSLAALRAQRDRLIAQMPSWSSILRGSLMRYAKECGSRGCKCHRGGAFRHGPYWHLVIHRGKGKQKIYLLPASKLRQVRQGRTAYNHLWRNLVRLSELNVRILKSEP